MAHKEAKQSSFRATRTPYDLGMAQPSSLLAGSRSFEMRSEPQVVGQHTIRRAFGLEVTIARLEENIAHLQAENSALRAENSELKELFPIDPISFNINPQPPIAKPVLSTTDLLFDRSENALTTYNSVVPPRERLDIIRDIGETLTSSASSTCAASSEPNPARYQKVSDFMAGKLVESYSPPDTDPSSTCCLESSIIFDHASENSYAEKRHSWLKSYDPTARNPLHQPQTGSTYLARLREKPWVSEWKFFGFPGIVGFVDTNSEASTFDEYEQEPEQRAQDIRDNYSGFEDNVDLRGGLLEDWEAAVMLGFASEAQWDGLSDMNQRSSPSYADAPSASSSDNSYEKTFSDARVDTEGSASTTPGQLWVPYGNFTQTKTWVSEEEMARVQYEKCMANLRYMGFDRFPLYPMTFQEWVACKAECAYSKVMLAKRKLDDMQTALNKERASVASGDHSNITSLGSDTQLAEKLQHISQMDEHSPVLARRTIWHPGFTSQPIADWPSYKEFKAEGDDRQKGQRNYRRMLPLPKPREPHGARLLRQLPGSETPTDIHTQYLIRLFEPAYGLMCDVSHAAMLQIKEPRLYSKLDRNTEQELNDDSLDSFTGGLLQEIEREEQISDRFASLDIGLH
ncbi:uncharacterized protein JN550_005895 [Neoarthrinium moseri]|uniref:uncharacterized protein n=1 Tax=Neoarthrinium moseri TaxID=1658444 RepID=UPI001FDAF1A3|nr:uncharacterized protein JN550_005895 [Neoarthrinium moseri]KAI1869265.1 hypothetical protein JN550_005895 [Neoarthrinium moseri]